ncbi:MAG: aldo/keto reductase [Rhodospirillales bacterium]|nr:aldo/keto reductase [Rhodospirillales bacterium]
MDKRNLGSDGTRVSAIGIGALSFTAFYGPTDTQKSHAILSAALDLGIDHLDTSNVYGAGLSEERIGSFLAAQGAARHGLFKIATKAGIYRKPDGSNGFDNSPAHIRAELDKSLQRLGVETIELFYMHRRDPAYPIEEVTETLAGLVKAGKIRQFGFSEIAPTSLARAAAVHPVGAVQSEYSLSTRSPELGLVQKTAELGTSFVAFSPVGRGLLTDTPPSPEKAATIPFLQNNPRFMEPHMSLNLVATESFRRLAADLGVKSSSLAIAWLLHQGDHVIPIPGTRSVDHLKELAAGAALKLTPADLDAIARALPVGWAHGDRYSVSQWIGPEKYG